MALAPAGMKRCRIGRPAVVRVPGVEQQADVGRIRQPHQGVDVMVTSTRGRQLCRGINFFMRSSLWQSW